uniref:Uncharacterized protein n=1 Tax=Oryzias latipes TaxID=8090 RepID=A0A3P9HFG0_ORYLA
MAGGKTSGSCSRFQANIFNRNKCQNCFKARELHLQNELEMEKRGSLLLLLLFSQLWLIG